MKLIIQIPAWNEEAELARTLASLPKAVAGFDEVEVQVVDDGSTDRTAEIAVAGGARVVRLPVHRGLAVGFQAGLAAALAHGADVIVNTDADGQYDPRDIETLTRPILDGQAQFVIGDRQIDTIDHFSPIKKVLQKLGSAVVRRISGTPVADATSGFRAISRAAALRINVFTRFTYTLETILQAGEAGIAITSVPIRVAGGPQRPSRLFSSNFGYIRRSLESMARIIVLYNPLRIFLAIGSVPLIGGAVLLVRFLYFYVSNHSPDGHIQSLLLAVILIVAGSLISVVGILADLIAVNRRLLEETLVRLRDQRE